MNILFDTNIILDVLLNRKPFVERSVALVSLVEERKINGYLCATTITTIDYLISKQQNTKSARLAIQTLLELFEIAEVNKTVLFKASQSSFTDFEDAVQHFSGKTIPVDALVTRNINDFKKSDFPVYTSEELWGILQLT